MYVVELRGMAAANEYSRMLAAGRVEIILRGVLPVKLPGGAYTLDYTFFIDKADRLYAEYCAYAVQENARKAA